MTNTWVTTRYLGNGIFEELHQPILEGFEKVLGRKFTCKDCGYLRKEKSMDLSLNIFWSKDSYVCPSGWCNNIDIFKICKSFYLSDDTKAEIKLADKKIEETKIDTHPRFSLGNLVKQIPSGEWSLIKGEIHPHSLERLWKEKTLIKLGIIL